MDENPDCDLQKPPLEPPPAAPSGRSALLVVAVLLAVLAGAAGYFYVRARPAGTAGDAGSSTAVQTAPDKATSPGREPILVELPPLDESDALVRKLVAELSSHPRIAAWLATSGLIRIFVVAVSDIADGDTPVRNLAALRPAGGFQVIERSGSVSVDPRSWERYTPLAAAVASIDPEGAASLYATLKPLLEEAHQQLGYPNTSFDRTLERAVVRLLGTPIPGGPIRLVPRALGYGFEDARIEGLSAAQKQLLRFGPQNALLVQASIRNIALALGIPAQRLPASPAAGKP